MIINMNYNPFSLAGKTILVTGASSGIGRSIAVECSKMGARVVITARNENRLAQTQSLMVGSDHLVLTADLSEEAQIEALVEHLPLLDGVVHCAGVAVRKPAQAIKQSDIDSVFAPNVIAPMLLQKHLLKKKRLVKGASVVFIASRAPFAPAVGNAVYSASKGAIIGYAKTLGLELAPKQIRVNCVCPAMVWTDLIRRDAESLGEDFAAAEARYPLKRFGQPEDVAWLSVYLLSDASSWMTGSCIDITGGGELTLV